MGSRPPSEKWLPAKKGNGKGKGQNVDVRRPQNQNRVAPPRRCHTGAPEQNRVDAEVRRNPNNVEADCADQIQKFEQAIEILGRDSPQSARVDFSIENDWMHARIRGTSPKTTHSSTRSSEEGRQDSVQVRGRISRRFRQIEAFAEEAAASHTCSMRVDPPDEVVEEAYRECVPRKRTSCLPQSMVQQQRKSTSCGHSARFAERAGFFEIGDGEESCGWRSRFRPHVQRRHHEVDGRPASRHPRGHHGRQRSRGGKALSCHGVRGRRMVNTEHVAVDGDQFSTLNPMDSQFSRQHGDASCSICVSRDARYGLRGIRIGEAAHPGPGRDSRRRRRVISSDDEVGSDDAPLVPPTVVDDVGVHTMGIWRQFLSTFQGSRVLLDKNARVCVQSFHSIGRRSARARVARVVGGNLQHRIRQRECGV